MATAIGFVLVAVVVRLALASAVDVQLQADSWFELFGASFYHQSLIPLVLVTVILAWHARPSTTEEITPAFKEFRLKYLLVWGFCVAADWMQGPYVYALYADYGFKEEIAQLFVAGFFSSLVFGSVVGFFADQFGRKKMCIAYCFIYMFSCLTKHFKNYSILMVGRIAGGAATSILFSGFECWMVSEHLRQKQFSSGLLTYMFGMMYTVMYSVAILTGFVSQYAADAMPFAPLAEGSMMYYGGKLGPFDCAAALLILGAIAMAYMWDENYGSKFGTSADNSSKSFTNGVSLLMGFMDALRIFASDIRIAMLCIIVACFEGSMYALVFNWTPALESEGAPLPHGLIFASFMMACMCGVSLASMTSNLMSATAQLGLVSLLASFSYAIAMKTASNPGTHMICYISFLAVEFCVGLYFPLSGIVKSELVPERVRTTVYNMFRVPLNGVVAALLLTGLPVRKSFMLCAGLVFTAACGVGIIIRFAPEPHEEGSGRAPKSV
mmetsp:Transcript_102512/g.289531  ORF Transcript_102512/g.289531 Transcript_102512/m.289531 type:complete len:496 (-) Transcript_102512:131-1618(-)